MFALTLKIFVGLWSVAIAVSLGYWVWQSRRYKPLIAKNQQTMNYLDTNTDQN